jgi:preprotein translocase subunit SecF
VHVKFKTPPSIGEVREALAAVQFGGVTIQEFGSAGEFLIRLPDISTAEESVSKPVSDALVDRFGEEEVDIRRVEAVGPRVGRDLRRKAILAVSFATLMMGLYLWFRFQWRFGIGAAVALIHDVTITLGALAVTNFELDLPIVAALLTVVGFSVNDTVVVSDRIRENMRKHARDSLASIINGSINETLSRTVLTTGTAVFVILALFILGGSVIHGFAFTLLVGSLVGTYSSIFVASPIVLAFERTPASRRRRR